MLAALAALVVAAAPAVGDTIGVGAGTPHPTIAAALAAARPGDTVVVHAGLYREHALVVSKPLVLRGDGWPVFDAEGAGTILTLAADGIRVSGLVFTNTGTSFVEDRAGIRVARRRDCTIEHNRFDHVMVGVYLDSARACAERDNMLEGIAVTQLAGGNGIHAWASETLAIARNRIRGHRDGIYFEFVHAALVTDNDVAGSARYGLHFMFSHGCTYERNVFRANASGVAVMYTNHVVVRGNTFADNRGGSAYGLLLKEINDSRVEDNAFEGNSTGLYLEGSLRNSVAGNLFARNGWGVRVLADAAGNTFSGNAFLGNAFDVATNTMTPTSAFRGNWWDRYDGYDLDRDGTGDVPYAPVRFFAVVAERVPAAVILLRSLLVDLLEVAERVAPVLTPEAFKDAAPRMTPPPALVPRLAPLRPRRA